jgi:hypothetical protein
MIRDRQRLPREKSRGVSPGLHAYWQGLRPQQERKTKGRDNEREGKGNGRDLNLRGRHPGRVGGKAVSEVSDENRTVEYSS